MNRLEEIKARAEAATEGPWRMGTQGGFNANTITTLSNDAICMTYGIWLHTRVEAARSCDGFANGKFLANSRGDVDWMAEKLGLLELALDNIRLKHQSPHNHGKFPSTTELCENALKELNI